MDIHAIGIDLAKNVFQVHGIDRHGKVCFRKQLRRSEMLTFFARCTPCLVLLTANKPRDSSSNFGFLVNKAVWRTPLASIEAWWTIVTRTTDNGDDLLAYRPGPGCDSAHGIRW